MHLFEKTKIGSARKHAALRPNPLETPAGHKVFVKRRCNFAPARRHPVDQLDGGRQLDPEGSREKKEFKIGPIEPVPPHRRTGREESWRRRRSAPETGMERREKQRGGEEFQQERFRRGGHGAKKEGYVLPNSFPSL